MTLRVPCVLRSPFGPDQPSQTLCPPAHIDTSSPPLTDTKYDRPTCRLRPGTDFVAVTASDVKAQCEVRGLLTLVPLGAGRTA